MVGSQLQSLLHGPTAVDRQVLHCPCADLADGRREGRTVPGTGQDAADAQETGRPQGGPKIVLQQKEELSRWKRPMSIIVVTATNFHPLLTGPVAERDCAEVEEEPLPLK